MNQVSVNPNQVQNQVLQVLNQVLGGYWGGIDVKSDGEIASRVERAKKTALLCEMMASAIRRDVYVMARYDKIGTAVGEGDKFVSPTGMNRKIVDLRRELLQLRDLL
ncbi:MAG: hypothetical protein SOV43_01335 [Selenomonadaceae bacterium]|nr:hypothetical protein [Selenomonadaceae bacterium]